MSGVCRTSYGTTVFALPVLLLYVKFGHVFHKALFYNT